MPYKPIDTYSCPWVPLYPCLGILGNFILIAKINVNSWLFFLMYVLIGLVFYFAYGIHYSKLNKERIRDEQLKRQQVNMESNKIE